MPDKTAPGEATAAHEAWLSAQDWSWQAQAACAGAPEDDQQTFTCPPFMRNERGATAKTMSLIAAAAAEVTTKYCGRCPVRDECYAWAKGDRYFVGIAGGVAFSGGFRRNTRRLNLMGKDAE